ncbi:hypothetical protein [Geomonas anaerohicana]|uniref:DUF2207 domain-containing protein n=1 Tax=Geomonas anaerohicana TaxID=2798583 RepID=A0ABS0Y9X3_9BACT|nr:hypothetical protein [Geomonas anaerohicana]MBJ6749075.1 hypothetical protein [Geomonas anaerohicana]
MALFEKISFDNMEDQPGRPERSLRSWQEGETLTIRYRLWPKLTTLITPVVLLPLFQLFLEDGFFVFQILCVVALVACWEIGADCLLTQEIMLTPDRIFKTGLLGIQEIPVYDLKLQVDKQENLKLHHGSDKNLRESIKVYRYLISDDDFADALGYLQDVHHVSFTNKTVGATESHCSRIALDQFLKSAGSYRLMAGFFLLFALIAIFTVGLSDVFMGMALSLPAYPIRICGIALAVAGFFLIRHWSAPSRRNGEAGVAPVMARLERADLNAFYCATVAVVVAGIGLVLFILFGNALDLYLFMVVAWFYFRDGYPRLSTWEALAAGKTAPESSVAPAQLLPRRSLQISLVLMGTLAVMSYGEENHYLYANKKDCQDDWGDSSCREVPGEGGGGGSYGGSVHYYGPRYGSGSGRAARAVGVTSVSRGGFGSLGGFHAGFGG